MTEAEFIETARRGDILPIPGRLMAFWCKGSETIYEVTLAPEDSEETDACECPGFSYRKSCIHLASATRYYQKQRRADYDESELRRVFA